MISKLLFPPAKIRDDPGILKFQNLSHTNPTRYQNSAPFLESPMRQCGEGLIISPAIRQIHISLTLLHHASSVTLWT